MRILVTGATGTVGKHVVEQLLRKGAVVRAVSRRPELANFPTGAEAVAGDLALPFSLEGAMTDVDGLYLILSSDQSGAYLQTDPAIIEIAKAAGIKRIVVLMDYEGNPAEQAVLDSGMEWTLLKPVEFMGNAVDDWRASIVNEGLVRAPFAHARSARVHEADIAAVAVAALTEEGHHGQSYVLTGPEVLTRIDAVGVIATTIGKNIPFVEQSEEEARQGWRDQGYGEDDIAFFVEMGKNPPEIGYTVDPAIERITGRPARSFSQWAAENRHYFE